MRNLIIGLILTCLIATPVIGQDSAQRTGVDITGRQGTFLLTISGSTVTVEPYNLIIPDDPTPPVPPVPPAPTDLTAQTIAAVIAIPESTNRNAVALKLSKTYEMLAGQTIPPGKAASAVSAITKLVLSSEEAQAWSGVLSLVSSSLGSCPSEAACDAVLLQISEAIGSTLPVSDTDLEDEAAAEKYGIDWDSFLSFLMKLLTVLLPLLI